MRANKKWPSNLEKNILPYKAKVRCYHVFHIYPEILTFQWWRVITLEFIYFIWYSVSIVFSPLYPKMIWPFLVLCCCDDIQIFGGEILACKPVLKQWVPSVVCETGLGGCLIAVLESNRGMKTDPFFNPFPASLSHKFVKKKVYNSSHREVTRALSPAFTQHGGRETNRRTRRG